MKSNFSAAVLAAVLSFGCVVPALGQNTSGSVIGTVRDASGAAVAQAAIAITNVATGVSRTTTTNAQGDYLVPHLPIGLYKVAATARGFERTVVTSQTALEINQTLRIDITLKVGSVATEVTVSSRPPLVQTQNSTVGGTVTGQAISELPLNGRNTLDLLKTQPGTTPTNTDSGAAGNYSIGGMRTDSVTYLVNGSMNNDLLDNGVVANPNPDAVAEFRVLESNYDAQYGRNAGGIVSVVTKSGTNRFHGTAYDYVRNDKFDANSFFNNQQGLPVSVLKRNQFGGTIGGPIVHNKLFFFFSYEGQRQSSLTSQGKVNTFTPAEARGDFSTAVNGAPDPNVVCFLSGLTPSGAPCTTPGGQPGTPHPFFQPNPALAQQGIIAPGAIDPVAAKFFSGGLIPTAASGFVFPQASSTDNYNEYITRIDSTLSDRDTISALISARPSTRLAPFDNANVVGYPDTNQINTYFGNLTWSHAFTPNLLNVFRGGAQRNAIFQESPAAKLPTAAQLGMALPSDDANGPPLVNFDGTNLFLGFSPQGPSHLNDTTGNFYDNVSWIRGDHHWKFGFSYSPYDDNMVFDFFDNGQFVFDGPSTGVGSGTDLADFLMGLPDEYFQGPRAFSDIRSKEFAAYAEDQWQIDRTLTLTLGLRYEYSQPKYDTEGRTFSYIPGMQSQRFPNAPTGLVFPGDPGAPTGVNFAVKDNFAPRLGFAWDVFGDGKTSLRGGWGLFYDVLKAEDNFQFNGAAPFYSEQDIFPNAFNGTGPTGLANPFLLAGVPDAFPSQPPTKNFNFANQGLLPFGGGGIFLDDTHLRTPIVDQYNLSLQRQLTPSTALEVGYLGYAAHGLTSLVDANPFILGTNVRVANAANPANPQFSFLNMFRNVSFANYNGLETSLRRTFSKMGDFGSSFVSIGYTWSHQLDNASGFRERNSNVPAFNPALFYASGDTDVRQAFTLSGGWTLPFENLWATGPRKLIGGWNLYPILTLQTGFPIDVFAGINTTFGNPSPSGAGDGGSVRADLVGSGVATMNPEAFQTIANPNNGGANSSGNFYFNPANFSTSRLNTLNGTARTNAALLPGFTYGTLPRNFFRGPGRSNLDLALTKEIPVGERLNVELRADAFNLFNHVEFRNPDTNPADSTFGQISTTYDPRIVQLAVHLSF